MTKLKNLSTNGGIFPVPDASIIKSTIAIVVEIGADRRARNLDIEYRWGSVTTLTSTMTEQTILTSVASGASTYLGQIGSLTRRLTLNVAQPALIIFRLSKDLDWQFSHDCSPISLGEQASSANSPSRKYYANARRIDSNGNGIPDDLDGCMVACFDCDGAGLTKLGGTGFSHPINLHVDLVDRDRDGKIVRRLPIIIDPDVKNPGGTQP